MIGRIVRSVDFERVLSAPARARSTHFAVHYVEGVTSEKPFFHKLSAELSTGQSPIDSKAVDDIVLVPIADKASAWVGAVVPKRHAKRSVTRSLLKRQIRAAMIRQIQQSTGLPVGLWVVRLRSPFATKEFPSAASSAMRDVARGELDTLLADAIRRTRRA